MKSTIKVDFQGPTANSTGGFEPVIRVVLENSDDTRDKLLKSFFEPLAGQSSWLVVKFEESDSTKEPKRITISPVAWYELQETKELIEKRIEQFKN